MGWSIGYDDYWERDIGYGVPAYCDHPECTAEIHRGLSYVCGREPYGGHEGCGLFFCAKHLVYSDRKEHQVCERCNTINEQPFDPKPEHPRWIAHVLTDASWAPWRSENPKDVERFRTEIGAHGLRAAIKNAESTPTETAR